MGGAYDISASAEQLRRVGEWATSGVNVEPVELRMRNHVLVATQGDDRAAFDANGAEVLERVDLTPLIDLVAAAAGDAEDASLAEARSSAQDLAVGAVLALAERRHGEISHWDVKAEIEDGLEVCVTAESGDVAMYRGGFDESVALLWVQPAGENVRLVAKTALPWSAPPSVEVVVAFQVVAGSSRDAEKLIDGWLRAGEDDDRLVSYRVVDRAFLAQEGVLS